MSSTESTAVVPDDFDVASFAQIVLSEDETGALTAAREGDEGAGESSDGTTVPPSSPVADEPMVPPVFSVTCHNCGTSIPLLPDTEGFEPRPSPHYHTCDECGGIGEVATGSLKAVHAVLPCPTCAGNGYVHTDGVAVPVVAAAVAVPDGPGDPPWQGAVWDSARRIWT